MTFQEEFSAAVLRAWHGQLEFAELINIAARLEAGKFGPLSAVLYQTWLCRNTSPYAYVVHFNLGVTLSNEGDWSGSEAAYRHAVEIHSGFVQPRLNLGILFERMGQPERALTEWRWVEQHISPDSPENRPFVLMALNHLGRVLEAKQQLAEALSFLTRSLAIEPNQPDVLHHWMHLRLKQCLWPVYAPLPGIGLDAMEQATSALAMINISDDPARQLQAARRFVEKKVLSGVAPLANTKGYGHGKLRIAYLSSDFALHPVSMLTAELFELHDREQFEVYGYCWSPQDGSTLRQRVIAAMDHFFRIDKLSDQAAAQLIREHEIDILVDLQGQTAGARANLLSYRPAPVQITYLGLPATTGLSSIDYVIADEFLIPKSAAPYYSEKPLYMPDIYQVSDRKRVVGPKPSRESCGLPKEGFVFCSLNSNYKYTPDVFDIWMNILRRTPGSVLWLLADNPWAEANLRREAETRGIEAQRLHFASRVSPENYLARYAVADLFLDTFPFNAGTTANDALWMCLPVLTCCGRSFASRMAGALLTAAKLEELITYNLKDYEAKAVGLAHDVKECVRLREHLKHIHEHGVLFDTPLFVRNLEGRLQQLVGGL